MHNTCSISDITRLAMYVLHNTEAHSYNHCCSGKGISVTYCECAFVALGIQHAMRMLCIMSSVACLVSQYFCTLSHKWHNFLKKSVGNKTFVSIFSTTFLKTCFILSRIERDRIKNVYWSSCKVPSYYCQIEL
jgi:hypothetical protein